MSTYTPCFPPTDATPSRRRRPISSNSSGTSTSGSHAPPKVSYSARLSRSHLALASVSEYIRRPPSPTSAAIDTKRVALLRRKFRVAIDATYRDTSSGKWAHVYEMAKLGSTRGRWQGICSGSSATYSLYGAHRQYHQGIAVENADPYPRPPVPVFDLGEIRERVENWQVDVLSTPFPQVHSEDFEMNRSTDVGHAKQFPIVKQRRSDVAKAMKCKDSSSRKNHSTSRYFCGVADPMFPDTDAVNRVTEAVTTRPSQLCESNVRRTSHSPEAPGEHPNTARKSSLISDKSSGQQNIQQVSELFLPPSFPSHLGTSTPPPFSTAKAAPTRSPLTKPPEIPRNENLCFSAFLASPLPFPLSQANDVDENQGHESQPNGSSSLSRHKRPLTDSLSPEGSPNCLSKQGHRSSAFNKPTPPESSLSKAHDDIRRRDRNVSSTLSTPEHVPVIDLRQLISSQQSRTKSRHPSHGTNPMTPRTKDKGKGRVMTIVISPSQQRFLSPPRSSRPLARAPSPHLWTPPHSQTNFTQDADAFAPAATSTQPPPTKDLPPADGRAFALSRGSQVDAEAHELRVSDALDSGVDYTGWMVNAPVLEGSQESHGVPARASQALEMMPRDEHV